MMKRFLPSVLIAASLASCDQKPTASTTPSAPAPPVAVAEAAKEEPWIPANDMGDWKPIEAVMQGKVSVKDGVLQLGRGDGVSGVKYEGKRPIPVVDYELSWEGMKVDGVDFFAAATFPVRDLKTCATFINGGWGGGVTGISCIDNLAANENNTTVMVPYKEGQWYKFRVQVTADVIAAFVDDKQVVKASIKDKQVSLRTGDIEACAPFGFATYMTKGAVKNIQFRKLKAGELQADLDTF